ncbi:MAG: hypothetical protein JJT94_07695 [Bernardetiaceae bacterium]|nr:hypothetical protein [Bernardetiaceae bacterium]
MKRIAIICIRQCLSASLILMALAFIFSDASAQLDLEAPRIDDLDEAGKKEWIAKKKSDFKAVFGQSVDDWNPIQMEFYVETRLAGLSDAEKKAMMEKSEDEWSASYGTPMENWDVCDMLFYAAIQNLKVD